MLVHVHNGDSKVRVFFSIVDKPTTVKPAGSSVKNGILRDIFHVLGKNTLQKSKAVYMSVRGPLNESSTNSFASNDFCTVTENPSMNEILVERQTVIPPRSESSVVVVFTRAGLRLFELKPVIRGREWVFVAMVVPNVHPLVPFTF